MLKKFLALGCVVALSAAFVGCEPAPVVDTAPPATEVTVPADEAVVVEDADGDAAAVVVEEPADGTN